MKKRFVEKRVLITGASSGIGLFLALAFVREGAKVALLARREDKLKEVASLIEQEKGESLSCVADVTKEKTLAQAVETICQAWGGIDIVVANAGFGVNGLIKELKVEDFRRQFETNWFGVLNTVYATLSELQKSKGQLVLMGSVASKLSFPGACAYSSSKFALQALAQSLYCELEEDQIAVTCILPGNVESNIARVDNQGVFHSDYIDPRPAAMIMPGKKAAHQMLNGIYKKKFEVGITTDGKILLWIAGHFPSLALFLAKTLGKKMREKKNRDTP